jgi:23S rRNA (guanine2445-N2)-methyltransferase / 23S rRNA (guanine2069-N7)-methyltransferase
MCGSGTLLIEGALLAADIAPGLLRQYYGFFGWKGFDSSAWQQLVSEAEERRREGLTRLTSISGADVDKRALGSARANARRAGLAGRIRLEVRDLGSLAAPQHVTPPATLETAGAGAEIAIPGLVVVNPPYGRRLGEMTELTGLYETLGARLRESFTGWQAAVFTANPELSEHLGLRAHRVNVLYNGPLAAKLLVFTIGPAFAATERRPGRTSAPPAERVMAGEAGAGPVHPGDAGPRSPRRATGPGAIMFANRLQKNLRHLRRWANRENIHCFRVYDADLPEYAVAVDVYGDWAHVQEYAAPGSVDPVQARKRLKEVMAMVPEVLGIAESRTVLKVRRPQRGSDQYQKLGDLRSFLEVEEGDLRFLVNLTDYLDTGLFLDHRATRRLIRELAPGRRFLNLFAYTGSGTVYAAAGGAASTTSVDLSRAYLEWAASNLELNGLGGPQHGFIRADCLEWLANTAAAHSAAHARGSAGAPVYDLIFLDAPTFSNSKSMEGTLDIQRDHPWLIRTAAALLSSAGVLLFSTNFRRFKLDPTVAEEFLVRDITRQTIPPDFARNPRIHSCFRIELGPRGVGQAHEARHHAG